MSDREESSSRDVLEPSATPAELLHRLRRKEQAGSKPRCHWLTHGSPSEVAERLTALIAPWGRVEASAVCLPKGFEDVAEAQLHKSAGLVSEPVRLMLNQWWLGREDTSARTPNWDIATSCMVGDERLGLLLIEAKAHAEELTKESTNRTLRPPVSADARRSHVRIAAAIQEANVMLAEETGMPWALTSDWNYQMSNRFAWAWKLAELGIPVVLVYLGFLNASEMAEGKRTKEPFAAHSEWEDLVRSESRHLFPAEIWNHAWKVHGVPFVPLIRSLNQAYDRP